MGEQNVVLRVFYSIPFHSHPILTIEPDKHNFKIFPPIIQTLRQSNLNQLFLSFRHQDVKENPKFQKKKEKKKENGASTLKWKGNIAHKLN